MTFKEERFARMLSLSVTLGLIGAIYGDGPVNQMCNAFGYQAVIYLFAGAGIVLALITYCMIPNSTNTSTSTITADIKEVLSNSKVLLSCFFAGLMVGPLEGFAEVWGTAFLKQVSGFDSATAAKLPSMIFIGMCFDSPFLNLVAEKLGSYLLTIGGIVDGAGGPSSSQALFYGITVIPIGLFVGSSGFALLLIQEIRKKTKGTGYWHSYSQFYLYPRSS